MSHLTAAAPHSLGVAEPLERRKHNEQQPANCKTASQLAGDDDDYGATSPLNRRTPKRTRSRSRSRSRTGSGQRATQHCTSRANPISTADHKRRLRRCSAAIIVYLCSISALLTIVARAAATSGATAPPHQIVAVSDRPISARAATPLAGERPIKVRRRSALLNAAAESASSPPEAVEFDAGSGPMLLDSNEASAANDRFHLERRRSQFGGGERRPLQIVRLFAPEAVQSQHENVTLDCMFKFDKKLDQRLTVKWYFNDELEPIYQWIPELNKRVYSDKYERLIDKSYAVSDDVDFMLAAYRSLDNLNFAPNRKSATATEADADESVSERRALAERLDALARLGGRRARQLIGQVRAALALGQYPASADEQVPPPAVSPGALAGGAADEDFNNNNNNNSNDDDNDDARRSSTPDASYKSFRAIRLVRPTSELSGRYTCSVSSLDSDALASTKLLVYEPARTFSFNVSRAPNNQYNLTCRAGSTFPRPTLSLFRYRAGPTEASGGAGPAPAPEPPVALLAAGGGGGGHAPTQAAQAHRPRGLASTQLRQEPLVGLQTQITVSAKQMPATSAAAAASQAPSAEQSNEISSPESAANSVYLSDGHAQRPHQAQQQQRVGGQSRQPLDSTGSNNNNNNNNAAAFEIVAWALVDEASLSFNLATQFECVLNIEGAPNYERRQSLALQRGWHLGQLSANGSAALVARSTLIGVLSTIASLLCLSLALVSTLVAFKLMRRYASRKSRVHSGPTATGARFGGGDGGGGGATGAPVEAAARRLGREGAADGRLGDNNRGPNGNSPHWSTFWQQPAKRAAKPEVDDNEDDEQREKECSSSTDGHCSTSSTVGEPSAGLGGAPLVVGAITEPEGVYRVPGDAAAAATGGLAFGSRLVIGANRWQMPPPPCNGVPVYGLAATGKGDSMAQQTNSFRITPQQQQHHHHQPLSAAQVNAAAADGLPRLISTTIATAAAAAAAAVAQTTPERVNGCNATNGARQVQPIQRQTIAVNGKALYC